MPFLLPVLKYLYGERISPIKGHSSNGMWRFESDFTIGVTTEIGRKN